MSSLLINFLRQSSMSVNGVSVEVEKEKRH